MFLDGNYSTLMVDFILKREIGQYVIEYYVPSMLLVSKLVQTECVRTRVVHARADVVATKLGNLLSFFLLISFFFFPSTYFSSRRGLPRKLKFGGTKFDPN